MKAGWKTVTLGEVCEVLDYKRRPVTKADRLAGPYPYYGATGVQDYVDQFIFDEPLVLLGEDGAKWKSGDRSAFQVSGKTWVNNHAHVLRPNREVIADEWLVYWLNYSDLTEFVTGVTVPKLNQANMLKIPVGIPPLAEQKRIVALLDEAFAGIDEAKVKAECAIRDYHDLSRGITDRLLFPPDSTHTVKALGEVVEIARGGSPRPIQDYFTEADDGINWIKISDATASGKYIYETAQKIKPSGLKKTRLVKSGDFLLSNSMSFGRPYIMKTTGCIHDGWLVLSGVERQLDQDYLYHVLGSNAVYAQFDRLAAGSTVRNLNSESASKVLIPIPPMSLQKEIAKKLDHAQDVIAGANKLASQKQEALNNLRASLLSQAFAGELTA